MTPSASSRRKAPTRCRRLPPRRARTPRTPRPPPGSLPAHEQREAALRVAKRLLASRERSERELRAHLARKGFDPGVAAEVVGRLREVGLQDDTRFAERWAADAVARGLSARSVQGGLRGRGVEPELAAAAAAATPEDEEARARSLARGRAARMGDLPAGARARRLVALLARRGYEPALARRVAAEASGLSGDADGHAEWPP